MYEGTLTIRSNQEGTALDHLNGFSSSDCLVSSFSYQEGLTENLQDLSDGTVLWKGDLCSSSIFGDRSSLPEDCTYQVINPNCYTSLRSCTSGLNEGSFITSDESLLTRVIDGGNETGRVSIFSLGSLFGDVRETYDFLYSATKVGFENFFKHNLQRLQFLILGWHFYSAPPKRTLRIGINILGTLWRLGDVIRKQLVSFEEQFNFSVRVWSSVGVIRVL